MENLSALHQLRLPFRRLQMYSALWIIAWTCTAPPALAQVMGIGEIRSKTMQVGDLTLSRQYDAALVLGQKTLADAGNLLAPENPDLLELRLKLGFAFAGAGRFAEAEEQYRIIVRLAPKTGSLNLLRDADLQIYSIALLDGRRVEASQAVHGALGVQRRFPPDQMLTLIIQSAATADLALEDSASALSLLLEDQRLLAEKSDPLDRQQRLMVTGTLIQLFEATGDERRIPDLFQQLHTLVSTAADAALEKQTLDIYQLNQSMQAGNFPDAIKRAIENHRRVIKETQDPDPYSIAKSFFNLAQVFYMAGEFNGALQNFRAAVTQYHKIFETRFLSMTEAEKHQFMVDSQGSFSNFYSFCLVYQRTHPELAEDAYRLALWQKTMVGDSLRAARERITHGDDPDLIARSASLQNLRVDFAERLRTSPQDPQLFQLQLQLEAAERDLAARLATMGFAAETTLEDLRNALPATDAAVEVVSFPFSDEHGPTNRVIYAAVVLQPSTGHPATMVRLGETILAERTGARSFPGLVVHLDKTYNSIPWLGIEPLVKGARRIYLASTGVLDATAFFAWEHSDGRYLLDHDEIDLRPVFSTAEIIRTRTSPVGKKRAVLIGNADFDPPGGALVPQSIASGTKVDALRDAVGLHVDALLHADDELKAVKLALSGSDYQVFGPFEHADASKQEVLSVSHPSVLHISTHGFFLPLDAIGADLDPLGLEISMQRSGLLLAGANRTLAGQSTTPENNGIVTAFETASLDLQGTDLVVLSACETGLGERSTAGEALGLRRSFHIAGAQRVLVSMWSVDDAATTELIRMFYENWLTLGEDPYQALRHAAKKVKAVNPDPHLWAPFVLYGP
jgi:tetratricopeptide (TPR) repeat protein